MTTLPAPAIAVYAPPKAGGTVLGASCALGPDALIVGIPNDLIPITSFLGIDKYNLHELSNDSKWSDISKVIKANAGKKKVIYVDDASFIDDRSYTNWKDYDKLLSAVATDAREAGRMGTTVIFRFHEQGPRLSSGKQVRGGPRMKGQQPEVFCGKMSIVLRLVHDTTASPWPFIMWTRPRADYVAGDRYTVLPDCCAMNLAEGLREAGIAISRPAGYEWMDKFVSQVSPIIAGDIENWRKTLREQGARLTEQLSKAGRLNPRVRDWALRDALHRGQFIHDKNNSFMDWLNQEETSISL